jgi:FkbM family methyltransferase
MNKIKQRIYSAWRLGGNVSSRCKLLLFQLLVPLQRRILKREYLPTSLVVRIDKKIQMDCVIFDLTDVAALRDIVIEKEYLYGENTSPSTIVDLGSNTGISVCYFNALFPNVHIEAFEPNPEVYPMLVRNCGQLKNVHLNKTAISSNNHEIDFFIHPHSTKSSSFTKRSPQSILVKVPGCTLDDILPNEPIDLLKFDIEGAEFFVFNNCNMERVQIFIGEIHEDIAHKSINEILQLFSRTHKVISKVTGKGRYMIYGTKK